ncbi:hypothetical protein [Hyalangium gracile]|uniref:hypothetical protein n=1 Tax=Hyalangium gracile TaxID=394092 RepID=UPI001CCB9FE1|nr:hypothetical protein [Hyalangium gracile]
MTTASPTDTRHVREVLPLGLMRDLPGMSAALPAPPAEPPSSIKAAIVRWLNAEL